MKVFKSLIAFVLLFAFLSSTTGMQVYKHYCGDFLAEVSIYIQSNPCADEGGEEACSKGKERACCDDETDFHQLDVKVLKSTEKEYIFNNTKLVASSLTQVDRVDSIEEGKCLTTLVRPPPQHKLPIYKRLQRLVFYA